jgi:hypothetical protein
MNEWIILYYYYRYNYYYYLHFLTSFTVKICTVISLLHIWAIIYILYYIVILHEIHKRKANWIGHILRRNCLLQRVIEGKIKGEIEVTGRQRRRRRKLLNDVKERRGYSHLKEEALDRTMWKDRFGRGFGPVVRRTTVWMNEYIY